MSNTTRNYTLHTLWIIVFLSIPIFTSPDFGHLDMFGISGFRRSFFSYVLLVLFFYINYYYFIPRYYFTKRYVLFGAFVLFSYAVIAFLPDYLLPMSLRHSPPDHQRMRPPMGFGRAEGGSIFQFLLVLLLSVMLRIRNRLRMINSEKLKAEVSYLKAQINPHFLFNTLNSLYALTIQKSDAAPDAVLKLSNMMRYVVTESTKDLVPLEREISYIKDYIDMQRLRVTDEGQLEFTITGDSNGKTIAPLVAIPFIENAFKYGINPEQDWHIAIGIAITGAVFTLDVYNKKVNVSFTEPTEQGIKNTKKRLDYIYPGTHDLAITDTPEAFRVHLKIELT